MRAADIVGARNAGLTPILIDRRNIFPDADCRITAGDDCVAISGWRNPGVEREISISSSVMSSRPSSSFRDASTIWSRASASGSTPRATTTAT